MHLHVSVWKSLNPVFTAESEPGLRVRGPIIGGYTLLPVAELDRRAVLGRGIGAREIDADEAQRGFHALIGEAVAEMKAEIGHAGLALDGARALIDRDAKPAAEKADVRTIDAVKRYIVDAVADVDRCAPPTGTIETFRALLSQNRRSVDFDLGHIDAALREFDMAVAELDQRRTDLRSLIGEVDALIRSARDPNRIADLIERKEEVQLRSIVTQSLVAELAGLQQQVATAAARIAEITMTLQGAVR